MFRSSTSASDFGIGRLFDDRQFDKAPKYAPESEKQSDGIGVVNYMIEGADFVRNARREDAYKKAFESCGCQYEILQETANCTDPTYVSTVSGNSITTSGYSSEYRYILFICK